MKIDKNNNHDKVVAAYERKLGGRDKRKRVKMKVSGASVKKLQQTLSRQSKI